MGLEIRPVRPEEMEEFVRVATTALVIPAERVKTIRPEWTLCAFADGQLVTSYAAWPLTMRFNGQGVPVAGVTFVGTLPGVRRRGYLRQIVAAHFELLHERGDRAMAILVATQAAIYHRYGYAVVATRNSYSIEPRYLQFVDPQPSSGRFIEVRGDEFGRLVELYRRFRGEKTGYLHRGKAMWEEGVLAPPPVGTLLARVIYEENDEPQGYVIYTVEPVHGPVQAARQKLKIRDLVWLTPSAYRAIWNYLGGMDLVREIDWDRVPDDDPLPHLLLEPRMLHMTTQDSILGRIVDVERALPQRRYLEEGVLTFEILDDLCRWNRGCWKLEASPAGTSLSRSREAPQVIMPVSTLALLVFGQIRATEAARMGRLTVREPNALPLWDKVMSTSYRPFCADYF